MKVIIDTDPGTDDALALMMALKSQEMEVLGLTTVGGNATLEDTTRNALWLLERLDRSDIPVYAGADRPLRGEFTYGYYYHGEGGLGIELDAPKARPRPQPADEYIIETASALRGEVTLIALGPLTNVARAIQKDRDAVSKLGGLVVMGGACDVGGNVTPYAEFNIYNDPVAASVVLSSGVPTVLVGLDVCEMVFVSRGEKWLAGRSAASALAKRLLDGWFALHPSREHYLMPDPLAIVAALRPELFAFTDATVAVECEDASCMGRTVAAYGDGHVRVASDVRAAVAKECVRRLLEA